MKSMIRGLTLPAGFAGFVRHGLRLAAESQRSAPPPAPSDVAAGTRRGDNVPRGIFCMIAATVLFAVSSALARWLVAIYPVGEVMFFRSASSFAICAAFVLPVTGLSVFATRRPRDHVARGLSQSISQTFTVLAFSLMPLAGAIAIN